METTHPLPTSLKREICAWFGFWARFVVLGLLAAIGALFAGTGGQPGDGTSGLILFAAAVALAFLLLKHYLDGRRVNWGSILVDNMTSLIAVIVVLVIVGLAGLFVAAGTEAGSLHDCGVALFLAAGLVVFLSLKRVFDNLDAHR